MADLICEVKGCGRMVHGKGLCGRHYQQLRKGRDPHAMGPRPISTPGWTPPTGLSPAWHDAIGPRSQRKAQLQPSCALSACAGIAVQGSDLCPAHDHYRAAQARLRAQGLA